MDGAERTSRRGSPARGCRGRALDSERDRRGDDEAGLVGGAPGRRVADGRRGRAEGFRTASIAARRAAGARPRADRQPVGSPPLARRRPSAPGLPSSRRPRRAASRTARAPSSMRRRVFGARPGAARSRSARLTARRARGSASASCPTGDQGAAAAVASASSGAPSRGRARPAAARRRATRVGASRAAAPLDLRSRRPGIPAQVGAQTSTPGMTSPRYRSALGERGRRAEHGERARHTPTRERRARRLLPR